MNVNLEIISGEGLKKIENKEKVGSGGFGIVYKATWRGQKVAIKELKANDFSQGALADFKRECEMMAKLRCNHLVGLYAITHEPYGLVMEWMEGGSLSKRLELPGGIAWHQRYRWAKEIGKGLEFLHEAGVFHRDIKSENVLLTKTGQAKLGDLGLAKLANTTKSTLEGSVGTYPWMAPELLKKNAKYTNKSDVYSYGVVLWEIASRKQPFDDVEMPKLIPMQVLMGELKLEIPEGTPKAYGDIIQSCCDVNPGKRPDIKQVVSQLSCLLKAEKEKVAKQPTKVEGKPAKPISVGAHQGQSGEVRKSTRPSNRGGYLGNTASLSQKTETLQAQKTEPSKLDHVKASEAAKTEQLRLELSKKAFEAEQLQLELEKAKEETRAELLKLELAKEKAKAEQLKLEQNKANEAAKAEQGKKEAVAQAERVKKEQRDRIEAFAFGGEKWKATFGDPGPIPPLPADIEQILSGPCPFWKGKKVQETHLLFLIPATIDGKPFTLYSLSQLIKNPKRGYATKYGHIDKIVLDINDIVMKEYGNKSCEGSQWMLMTRDVIKGTQSKSYEDQQVLAKTLGNGLYQVPTVLEVVASILTEYAASGSRLYSDNPMTYTRCQEPIGRYQVCVGGFSTTGLDVHYFDYGDIGAAFVRKFLRFETSKEIPKAEPGGSEKTKTREAKSVQTTRLEMVNSQTHKREQLERTNKEASVPIDKSWRQLRIDAFAFGEDKWRATFGDPGRIALLPSDISQILSAPCPFWKGKKVQETHLLVFIPETVNGTPFTLRLLGKLIEHPKQGHATKYSFIPEDIMTRCADTPAEGSHWLLMTRDVVEGTRKKSFKDQKDIIEKLGKGLYQVPTLLDAAACILLEHAFTGRRLYSDSPWTYTRCQEAIEGWQTAVGGFSLAGLEATSNGHTNVDVGLGCLRKF